jgi:low temperature requirement protein LtrA
MDLVTISTGAAISLYGVYTLVMRTKAPEKFGKLTAMKAKYGDSTGTAAHILAYTVLPIVAGIILSFAGLNGLSILGILKN